MPLGGYVRTNYRRTVGMPRLDAIGGGYPFSSQTTCGKTAGCGTTDPYGGFIWLSWTGQIQSAAADASLAGISSRWVESTYGLMQSYFGNVVFDSGYAFLPVIAYAMSTSGLVFSTGEPQAGTITSFFGPLWTGSFRTSGSYAIFTPLMGWLHAKSDYSFVSLSGATADFQIGGFIVSTPYA